MFRVVTWSSSQPRFDSVWDVTRQMSALHCLAPWYALQYNLLQFTAVVAVEVSRMRQETGCTGLMLLQNDMDIPLQLCKFLAWRPNKYNNCFWSLLGFCVLRNFFSLPFSFWGLKRNSNFLISQNLKEGMTLNCTCTLFSGSSSPLQKNPTNNT